MPGKRKHTTLFLRTLDDDLNYVRGTHIAYLRGLKTGSRRDLLTFDRRLAFEIFDVSVDNRTILLPHDNAAHTRSYAQLRTHARTHSHVYARARAHA